MSKKIFASIINDLNGHLSGMEDKKQDREEEFKPNVICIN